jgi:hypothetical protein
MTATTGNPWRVVPGYVPRGAVPLAVLDLCSPHGFMWRERLWLLREHGRDSLWAAVADSPDRAIPVAAADADGSLDAAGYRLLAGYLAATSAEISAASPASAMLPAERLAAILTLRRAGGVRH